MTYSEKLKDPRWQKKRLLIMQRDGFKCRFCQDAETCLHIHHLNYQGEPWDIDEHNLITLCEHCHELAEFIKDDTINIIRVKKIQCDNVCQFIVAFSVNDIIRVAIIYRLVDKHFDDESIRVVFTVEKWNKITQFINT